MEAHQILIRAWIILSPRIKIDLLKFSNMVSCYIRLLSMQPSNILFAQCFSQAFRTQRTIIVHIQQEHFYFFYVM
jgi:hypothetical protein